MSSRTRVIKDILWAAALAGLVAAGFRLWFGLGATTNLSDAVPWGLWKILNMVGGVALSTSGFTVGFLVYVLRLKKFQPFMRPAILIAFLGYGCSCTALLFDIGLPQRFWHPILMWNVNSFLFEVFWCVLLYFTVTAVELSPIIFERFRAGKAAHILHRVAFAVVVIGISLSSLHHSSLGSLFLVTPQRLHPLWYTPWLPALFIVSAMGAGLMVVVLVSVLWARWYEPASVFGPCGGRSTPLHGITGAPTGVFSWDSEGPEMPRIRSLATIAATVLGLYLILEVTDLLLHGGWKPLLAGTWESWLYLLELTLTAILPILLVALPWPRRSPAGIAAAAVSAALGLALNRLDVGIFGYFRSAGAGYFPSLIEWVVGLGVVAAAGLVFFFVAENLPIFSAQPPAARSRAGLFRLSYGNFRQLGSGALSDSLHRTTLLAVFVIPAAFALMYPPYFRRPASGPSVRPTVLATDVQRTRLRIDADRSGVVTVFPHAGHQKRLGGSASCGRCHHASLPHDKSTPCSRCHRRMNVPTDLFDHEYHVMAVARHDHLSGIHPENFSCVKCHPAQRPQMASGTKDCLECHKKDMFPAGPPPKRVNLRLAISFREAMHRMCIECHKAEAVKQHKPHLGDCGTCHESLRPQPAPQTARARAPQPMPNAMPTLRIDRLTSVRP